MDLPVDRKKPTYEEKGSIKKQVFDNSMEPAETRRTIVKKMAVGSAALACCSALPSKWMTPILEFGCLPAHATTSVLSEEVESPYNLTEQINRGPDISIDKVLRRRFVSDKLGPDYGTSIKIEFNTGGVIEVPNTRFSVNVDKRGYRPGGGIDEHSASEIPTMEVYAEPGSRATYITVYYEG